MRAFMRAFMRALGSLSLAGILSCATPSPPQATAPEAIPSAPVALAPAHEPSADAGVAVG